MHFVTLHRGSSAATARVVAVTTDESLAAIVAAHLLDEDARRAPQGDAVLDCLREGRSAALEAVLDEVGAACGDHSSRGAGPGHLAAARSE